MKKELYNKLFDFDINKYKKISVTKNEIYNQLLLYIFFSCKKNILIVMPTLNEANELYSELARKFMVSYDEAGSIGKRYRRADAVGTPYCITIDDETLNNDMVTIRDRDTMQQVTIKIDEVEKYLKDRIYE